MCVILYCPKKVRPSLETLQACAQANPHGAGIAWREHGQVRWLKTNDVAKVYRLARARRGEIVIHFRIASVGRVCPELRHPFPVSKRAGLAERGTGRAVLFQNGTWSDWQRALDIAADEGHEIPEGEMSDARAAAFLCSIYGAGLLKHLAPSRWVFFGAKQTEVFGAWHKVDGVLFSNTYWQRHLPSHAPTAQGLELWDMSASRRYWEIVASGPKR